MKKINLLLIDDDVSLAKVIGYQLGKSGFLVDCANNGREGLEKFNKYEPDVIVLDIQMPEISGIQVLNEIRKINNQVVIIIITAYGSVDNALEACKLGADDYITKPFGIEQLLFVIEKARRLRSLQQENTQLRLELTEKHTFGNLIARSAKMEEVLRVGAQVAASEASVLIFGESGTGKELLARAIHYSSPRNQKPLVTVNCPSIPENLLESELFGHVKGAFTGAIKDRKGKFQLADGGTIFLDEIGDLHENLQAKMLRVLQEHEFERVGETNPVQVDVRVIAATNHDLIRLIKEGRFREDLYYRLSVVPITIPPLRERKEEIPYLVHFFVEKYGKGKKFEITKEFVDLLQQYDWPGNIRELENTVERAIVLSMDGILSWESNPSATNVKEFTDKSPITTKDITFADSERRLIKTTLEKTRGNRSEAARILDIPRHVLLYRIKKLGLDS